MCFRSLFRNNAACKDRDSYISTSSKQHISASEKNHNSQRVPDKEYTCPEASECEPYSLAGGMRLVAHQPDTRPGVKHMHRLFDNQGSIIVVCSHPDGPELKMIEKQIIRYLERGLRK